MSVVGREGREKGVSRERAHHEIIMVYIKCNLAKRMQRCIESRAVLNSVDFCIS